MSSRVAISDHARLALFVAGRGVAALRGRIASSWIMRWPSSRRAVDRLIIAPQDLRTADPTRAAEIYAGRFVFAGKVVMAEGRSPFDLGEPSREWAAALHGFGWLRHLRAADTAIARANARALVEEWLQAFGRNPRAFWQSHILSRRLKAWLTHSPLILQDADHGFYRRFAKSIVRQARHLRRLMPLLPHGLPRLDAAIALTYAGLCLAGQGRLLRLATRRLCEELDAQILPDGGHASRNPGVVLDLLVDLLPLRQAFSARNLPPPPELVRAIDRMMPMLRFFRHGDGTFAHFNGMGPTEPDLVATVLAYDDARGQPLGHATHSGYQRLQAGDTLVIMDTGAPPRLSLSAEAHAGCLAFELSSGRQPIIVNCGLPATHREAWRTFARTTAAHSTATIEDTSSSTFLAHPNLVRWFGALAISGPKSVASTREEAGVATILSANHDGYAAAFGLVHRRRIALGRDGTLVEGEDTFVPAEGRRPGEADRYAIRFHLHPAVKASRLVDGRSAVLVMPTREAWTFTCRDAEVTLEESVWLPGAEGPRRTTQLVVTGRVRETPVVSWSFTRAGADRALRREGADEPQLPLA